MTNPIAGPMANLESASLVLSEKFITARAPGAPLPGDDHDVEQRDTLQTLFAGTRALIGHDHPHDVIRLPRAKQDRRLETELVAVLVELLRHLEVADEVDRHQRRGRV